MIRGTLDVSCAHEKYRVRSEYTAATEAESWLGEHFAIFYIGFIPYCEMTWVVVVSMLKPPRLPAH